MSDSWWLMMLIALTLGIRHGFDLDHLATIDAMTRTVRENAYLSKRVGILFSLGHGLVVTFVSLIVGSGLIQSHVPQWLEATGSWISILFLFLFGLLNLSTVFSNSSQAYVPAGIKSFVFKKLANRNLNPLMMVSVGALFAISFDTISQVALFSLSASVLAGWLFSGVLGAFFTLGMMISDGLNGLIVATLIQRADRVSMMFSRGLGLTISMFSLIIGCMGVYKILM